MAQRTLVTGGCGFIGHHLVEALRARGDEVHILDLRPWQGKPLEKGRVVLGSITDPVAVRKAMAGVDRVFHVAANPNLWAPDPKQFHEVNFVGTCRVLEEAARQNVERIVYTSTESILKSVRVPRRSPRSVIDETASLKLDDMPGPYCRSKFQAEAAAQAAAASGLPVVIVNPTMPLGPGDRLLTPPTKMMLGFINGKMPAYLNCEFNLVDARDAALGHILAAEHGRIGERYILGAENVELRVLLKELSVLTGRPMPALRIPYGVAFTAALVSEGIANLRKRPPVAPITGVRLARNSMAFDCSKAQTELQWPVRPLRQTIYDAIVWLRDAGLVKRDIALPNQSEPGRNRQPVHRAEGYPQASWTADRNAVT
jgi:dihydroflavonol-4-reductase